MATDYAASFGIHSLAAAVVFAILYVPLVAFFLFRSFTRPCYVYGFLAFFSIIRLTAFIIRALLSHVAADAQNLHLLVAYEIIYNVGFFGLLYSTYTLVTDRVALAKNPPSGPISRLLRLRFVFRLILTAAVTIGITGAVDASTGTTKSTISTGNTLRKVAIYIFLVCIILVLFQTFFLARAEFSEANYGDSTDPIGATYALYILLAISVLLVAREAFFAATANDTTEQNKEALWYPLSAVTEYLAVLLFAIPGLVPVDDA